MSGLETWGALTCGAGIAVIVTVILRLINWVNRRREVMRLQDWLDGHGRSG